MNTANHNTAKIDDAFIALENALTLLQALNAEQIESANLVPMVKAVQSIGAFSAAIDAQIQARAIGNGELIPGVVVKDSIVHRKWHDQLAAEQLAAEQFGEAAFDRKLKSPAQLEKLDGGDTFVAVASFKPEAGKRVVY